MKIFSALVVLLFSWSVQAQKIDFEEVKFEYVRLPLAPFPQNTKSVSLEVVLNYEEDSRNKKEAREAYEKQEIERAQKEKEDYDKKSYGEKLLINKVLDSKPTGAAELRSSDYIAKIYDKAIVAGFANIPGYAQADQKGDVHVTVFLDGFIPGQLNERIHDPNAPKPGTLVNVNNNAPAPLKYYYELEIKHPVHIKIADATGKVLKQEILEGTNDFIKVKTAEYQRKEELYAYWQSNRLTFFAAQDEQIFNANMKKLADYMAHNFGFTTLDYKTGVAIVRAKDVNYDEYTLAYEKAVKAYNLLAAGDRKEDAVTELKSAIDLWNKALAESDIKNKKARIDANVTEATYLNCAEAYCWLNEYTLAEDALLKLKINRLNKYSNRADRISKLIQDQKIRYRANNN